MATTGATERTPARRRTRSSSSASDLIRIDTTNTGDPDTGAGSGRPRSTSPAKLAEVGLRDRRSSSPERRAGQCRSPGSPGADPARGALLSTATSTWCPPTPATGRCTRSPARSQDGYVWGRGAVDMKDMDAMIARRGPAVPARRRRPAARPRASPSSPTRRPAACTARTGWSTTTRTCSRACTEAISEVGGFSLTVRDGRAAVPDRDRREGHRLDAADGPAAAPGTAR